MRQGNLFDICAGNHGGNELSEDAHADNFSRAEAQRRRILAAIQASGVDGMTCDELEVQLSLTHQSCSARCAELKKAEKVRERGWRNTRTGSKAGVLVAVTNSERKWWHE